jgi:Family of unknown function (DUF5681)
MAFKKGISGNPGGRSREKIFTDALRLELNRVDPTDKDKRKKINLLAEKLVECAIKDKPRGRSNRSPIASKASRCKWSTRRSTITAPFTNLATPS